MSAGFTCLSVMAPLFILGCAAELSEQSSEQDGLYSSFIDPNDPFAIPDALYTLQPTGEDSVILHPAGFLGSLEKLPETDCEKEKLRRLVISMNMYSYDMMNQSYFIETKTSGVQILEKTFPDIKKLYGERGTAINIDTLSDFLRGVQISC